MLYAIFQSRSILTWAKYEHATLIKYKNSPSLCKMNIKLCFQLKVTSLSFKELLISSNYQLCTTQCVLS